MNPIRIGVSGVSGVLAVLEFTVTESSTCLGILSRRSLSPLIEAALCICLSQNLQSFLRMRQKLSMIMLLWAAGSAMATVVAEEGLSLAEVVWEHPLSDTFSFGTERGSWSRAERLAVELRLPTDAGDRVSPWGGLHIGGDTRAGEFDMNADGSGGGHVSADALVLALTGGGRFHFFDREKRGSVDPAIALFGRAGVGFQDGRVTGYQTAQGPASGDLSPLRYEFAVGTAFELVLKKNILLSAGVGVTWMFANQATFVRVENGQGTAVVSATYAGFEVFSRLGAGIRF